MAGTSAATLPACCAASGWRFVLARLVLFKVAGPLLQHLGAVTQHPDGGEIGNLPHQLSANASFGAQRAGRIHGRPPMVVIAKL
jgi:hypothetical protein